MEYYVLSYIFQLFTSDFSFSNEKLSVNFISVSGCALEKQFKLCSVLFRPLQVLLVVLLPCYFSLLVNHLQTELEMMDGQRKQDDFLWSWLICHLNFENTKAVNKNQIYLSFYSDSDQNQQV